MERVFLFLISIWINLKLCFQLDNVSYWFGDYFYFGYLSNWYRNQMGNISDKWDCFQIGNIFHFLKNDNVVLRCKIFKIIAFPINFTCSWGSPEIGPGLSSMDGITCFGHFVNSIIVMKVNWVVWTMARMNNSFDVEKLNLHC